MQATPVNKLSPRRSSRLYEALSLDEPSVMRVPGKTLLCEVS